MVSGWITVLMLAFGIVVAIIGVIAYLQLFNKEKASESVRSTADIPPPFGATNKPVDKNESSVERPIIKP